MPIETELERRVRAIFTAAAKDIVAAVRTDIGAQIGDVLSAGAAAPSIQNGAAARIGAKPKRRRRRRRRGRGIDDVAADNVLVFIRDNPRLRSEELQKRVGLRPEVVKTALAQLRAAGRVTTTGIKRAATYTVAG